MKRISMVSVLAVGGAIAIASPGLASVGSHSVPKPAPRPKAASLTLASTAVLGASGTSVAETVAVSCPTGYAGRVDLQVVGRATQHGMAVGRGSAAVTCTGASQTVTVNAVVHKGDKRPLKAGKALQIGHLSVRNAPAKSKHGHAGKADDHRALQAQQHGVVTLG